MDAAGAKWLGSGERADDSMIDIVFLGLCSHH